MITMITTCISKLFSKDGHFEESKNCYLVQCIKTTTFTINIILVVYLISLIIRGTGDLERILGLSFIFFLSVSVNVIASRKWLKTHVGKMFSAYLILILILAYEFTLKYFQNNSKKEVFMGGFISTYIICLAFLSRMSWLNISMVLLAQTILICTLVNVDEPNTETSVTTEIPVITLMVSAFFTNIAYKLEKTERDQFVLREKNKNTLESLKRLIDSSLPDQIFIIPQDAHINRKIYFKNEAAQAAVRSAGFDDMIAYLETVKLESFYGRLNIKTPHATPTIIEFLKAQGTNSSYFKSFLCKLPLFFNKKRESRSSISSPDIKEEPQFKFTSNYHSQNVIIKVNL